MSKRKPGAARPAGAGAGLGVTLAVHGGAIALMLGFVEPIEPMPPVYAVELVAAPAPSPRERLAPEAMPTAPPEEAPAPVESAPPPEPEPEPELDDEPAPAPKPPEPKPEPRPQPPQPSTEPAPRTSAPEAPAAGETPSTGRDATTLSTPGLDFPYPEYLRNVMNQIYRRWRRPTGNVPLRAEIFFLVRRDGSIAEVRFVKRSGNFSYDLEAQGAIEAAGNAKAFGQLPDGWEADVLPISFYFEPRSQ